MRNLLITGVMAATLPMTSTAFAQFQQQLRVQNYSAGFRTTTSAILGRPTVSPYLALTDLTGTGQVDTSQNYFTQVRPRLERQQRQRAEQLQLQNIQQEVSDLRSSAARRAQAGARATGHPTRFNNYLQYYPGFSRR